MSGITQRDPVGRMELPAFLRGASETRLCLLSHGGLRGHPPQVIQRPFSTEGPRFAGLGHDAARGSGEGSVRDLP